MERLRQALLRIAALGMAHLQGTPAEPHDHTDSRLLHEASLSWARTIFSHAAHTHSTKGVTATQVRMLAGASEELDNCFVAQTAGSVLLTSWLMQALAEATGTEPEQLYRAIKLQLAQIGTDVP